MHCRMLLKRIECSVHYKAGDKFLLFWMSADTKGWWCFCLQLKPTHPQECSFAETPPEWMLIPWFFDSLWKPQPLPEGTVSWVPPLGCFSMSLLHFGLFHGHTLNLVLPATLHCWHSKWWTSFVMLTSQIPYISISLVIPWGMPCWSPVKSSGSCPSSSSSAPTWNLLLVKFHRSEGFFLPVLQTHINSSILFQFLPSIL